MPGKVVADLHVHSRFSRATSKRLGPAWLDRWARIKGLALLGTGDCTHPAWLGELREQLDDAEEGLYTLKREIRSAFDTGPAFIEGLPDPEPVQEFRFVLTGEISTLYRQGDRTRKIHHLVILPDFEAAAAFQTKLERVGNIVSDGRPILGINSRDLMGMLLEADERAMLIPAHIWTPWFSVLGAKSGFDSIKECYGDLTSLIPAVETGLSSNPPMNWALSDLDCFRIISNSDAHSPDKLGREATVLSMDLSYSSLREALFAQGSNPSGSAPGIIGTIEFFPQEGKYHYDGHRDCGVFLAPEEAKAAEGICPVCGKALTRGVMGRVKELADRPVDETAPCPPDAGEGNRRPYSSLIPLREILGEIQKVNADSKKVGNAYSTLIQKGGTEFSILMDREARDLEKLNVPGCPGELLAAAITRMRSGEVLVSPGYDGEYGSIRALPSGSAAAFFNGADLFGPLPPNPLPTAAPSAAAATPAPMAAATIKEKSPPPNQKPKAGPVIKNSKAVFSQLSPEQEAAVSTQGRFAIIIAGPGTGKTAALTARINRLLVQGIEPASILALSFTVKAAMELRERITRSAGEAGKGIVTATFHSLCASLLREEAKDAGLPKDFTIIAEEERELLLRQLVGTEKTESRRVRWLGQYIENRKQFLMLPREKKPPFVEATADLALLAQTLGLPPYDGRAEWIYKLYREELRSRSALDFDDLVSSAVRLLLLNKNALPRWRGRFKCILVDEYQDVNFAQYILIRLLAGEAGSSLWVIGDPNQAIYAFRGSDRRFIDRFVQDYVGAEQFHLTKSFRCAAPLTDAAGRLVGASLTGNESPVSLYRSAWPTEKSEAQDIARRISALIGGSSFFAIDSRVVQGYEVEEPCTPGDCAILLRTTALAPPIIKALEDHGIPYDLAGEKPWWEEEAAKFLLDLLKNNPDLEALSPVEAVQAAWKEALTQEACKKYLRHPQVPEPVSRLMALAAFFDTVPVFLDALAISDSGGIPELAARSGDREGVRIMSIHASKGLEFAHVFVAALEEGLLPFTIYDKAGDHEEETGQHSLAARIEEERRLLYVAMTRARKGLYLSWTTTRVFKGRVLKIGPSRFLDELEMIPLLAGRDRTQDPQMRLF